MTKLIGTDTQGDSNAFTGYVIANQFVCDVTGTLTHISVYCNATGNVRVAIYAEEDGNPDNLGDLIAESASTNISAGAWREIAVAGGGVTSGTKYWLAEQNDTLGGVLYRAVGGQKREYKAQAYGAFPANGTGFSADTGFQYSLQGLGYVVWAKSLSDTISIADSPSKAVALPKADTITIADLAAYLNARFLSLADTIAISDSFSKVSEFNPSKSDSIAIVDTPAKAFSMPQADSLTIADIISKGMGIPQADSLAIADVLTTKAIGLGRADAISIADSIIKVMEFSLAIVDTVAISDALLRSVGVGKSDIVSIADDLGRLIGSAYVSSDWGLALNIFSLSKFTAIFSGDIVRIKIYCGGSINIKIAVYDDNAGEPGNLMNAINTSTAIIDGWNTIAFPATTVVAGTDYWLGVNSG